jgi:prepilin-type N-terminal cleavage/methylation domain-containing protein
LNFDYIDQRQPGLITGGLLCEASFIPKQSHRLITGKGSCGFSLVEVLIVLSIIAILSIISIPLMGISSAGNVNAAVSDISLLLNQSRAYAMAHNSYVWIGFSEEPATNPTELAVGVVAGASGQSTDLSSGTTYFPISKVHVFNQLTLKKVSSLPSIPSGTAASGDDIFSSAGATQFTQSSAGTNLTFSQILQYDPQGTASAINTATGATHQVQIGLQPLRGNLSNVAVLQVTSLTGQVRVFRP